MELLRLENKELECAGVWSVPRRIVLQPLCAA